MPLSGTFDVLDFTEVLRLLGRQELTGRLHVRNRSYGANLFFEDGQVVGADQSEHQTAAVGGDVRGRLEEICFELLDSERGNFEFHPGRPGALPATTRLKVEGVLTRARKRLEDWHELQSVIPSLDLQPRLVVDLERTEVTIDRERWRLLTAIDGRRNLHAIGRALNLSDFDVCRVTRSLVDDGIVELDGRTTALAIAAAVSDAEAPPLTETVTTLNGKQALKAVPPSHAGEVPSKTITIPDVPPAVGRLSAGNYPGEDHATAEGTGSVADKAKGAKTEPIAGEGVGRRRRVVHIRSRLPKPEAD